MWAAAAKGGVAVDTLTSVMAKLREIERLPLFEAEATLQWLATADDLDVDTLESEAREAEEKVRLHTRNQAPRTTPNCLFAPPLAAPSPPLLLKCLWFASRLGRPMASWTRVIRRCARRARSSRRRASSIARSRTPPLACSSSRPLGPLITLAPSTWRSAARARWLPSDGLIAFRSPSGCDCESPSECDCHLTARALRRRLPLPQVGVDSGIGKRVNIKIEEPTVPVLDDVIHANAECAPSGDRVPLSFGHGSACHLRARREFVDRWLAATAAADSARVPSLLPSAPACHLTAI